MLLKKLFRSWKNTVQFKRKHVFLSFAFFCILFILFFRLKIRSVDCSLNNSSCPDQILTLTKSLIGRNFVFFNQNKFVSSLNQIEPIEKDLISFSITGKLVLRLKNNQESIDVSVFYLQDAPVLSMNDTLISSQSATFNQPSLEIKQFLQDRSPSFVRLWSNGSLTPIASSSSQISIVSSANPATSMLSDLYRTIKIVSQYTVYNNLYILNDQIFLSRDGQPDIIILVPSDEVRLKRALSSIGYFTSIKQDAKILDLRFRNPVIR